MTNQWSELPPELLSQIAERLGLIDVLGFRGVCKAWNSAASFASAEIESSQDVPWFLAYGESSRCPLLTNEGRRYTVTIPEMEEATCLASASGWLLLFHHGSMFFFCPFSRARIDLPGFPYSKVSDHVAAFSSPPTSEECDVVVIHRSTESNLELNTIRRGETGWTKLDYPFEQTEMDAVKAAAYHNGYFQFLDDNDNLVTFSPEVKVLKPYIIVYASNDSNIDKLTYRTMRKPFLDQKMTKESGLYTDYSCINTCGTLTESDELYFNERVSAYNSEDTTRVQAKGVWIQPRFHQISVGQSWAI